MRPQQCRNFVNHLITADSSEFLAIKQRTKVTMEVLKNIAEDMDGMIKLTTETPCNYDDCKMPSLNVKVKITHGGGGGHKDPSHYKSYRATKKAWEKIYFFVFVLCA